MGDIIVIHFKKTLLAMAPDEILKIQKLHGKYNYILIQYNFNTLIYHIKKYLNENKKIIIHFHNNFTNHQLFNNVNIMKIIHYHSEPTNSDITILPKTTKLVDKKLVLNQYHCTLDIYEDCEIVRNFFNWKAEPIFNTKTIKIGYSPSVTKSINKYYDKGYLETVSILGRTTQKYDVIVDIIVNKSYSECINRKKDCHIIIDECKTGSFHKCTIEGLMLGSLVFVNINENINKIHIKEYGQTLPVINCDLTNLENKLEEYIGFGKDKLETLAKENRNKFMEYWNAKIVCQEFDNIYSRLYI